MIVHPVIDPAVKIASITAIGLDHIDGRGLASAFIAAGAVPGPERSIEPCRKVSFRFEKCFFHRRDNFSTGQDISLDGVTFAGHGRLPRQNNRCR